MYYWPLDKIYVTQGFGANPQIYAKYGMKGHDGIDLRTRFSDTPLAHRYVSAAADGVVEVERADKKGYGWHIRVRHPDGALTIYAHLSKFYVAQGQHVKAQQVLGLSGNTGDSTGAHLHFELRPAGWEGHKGNGYAGAVDPKPFMLATLPKQFFHK